MNGLLGIRRILIAGLMSVCVAGAQATGQAEKDPHRPACTGARCREIKSFLKAHYCGESPFGNGPDDGCEIKVPKRHSVGVTVRADYHCEWNEKKQVMQCEQHGQPSPNVRSILISELRRLGMPANSNGQTYFTVWESARPAWTIAEADYTRLAGPNIELSEVVVILDQNSHVLVMRQLPFQKTDADVPAVTQWSPIDLADVDGDGQLDIILEGDAYEDHWLEVVSMHDGALQTIFSGLGYYL